MAETWRYLVLNDAKNKPYALVRTDQGVIERWQPESKAWINASFNTDQVYGEEWKVSKPITVKEAEALQASGEGLTELSTDSLQKLSALMQQKE